MYDTLTKAGINSVLHRIDNEFLKELIEEIESRGLKYQIAPRGNHRTIAAERGIQTLKITSNQYYTDVIRRFRRINGIGYHQ